MTDYMTGHVTKIFIHERLYMELALFVFAGLNLPVTGALLGIIFAELKARQKLSTRLIETATELEAKLKIVEEVHNKLVEGMMALEGRVSSHEFALKGTSAPKSNDWKATMEKINQRSRPGAPS